MFLLWRKLRKQLWTLTGGARWITTIVTGLLFIWVVETYYRTPPNTYFVENSALELPVKRESPIDVNIVQKIWGKQLKAGQGTSKLQQLLQNLDREQVKEAGNSMSSGGVGSQHAPTPSGGVGSQHAPTPSGGVRSQHAPTPSRESQAASPRPQGKDHQNITTSHRLVSKVDLTTTKHFDSGNTKPGSLRWSQHIAEVCKRNNISWSRETLDVKTLQSIIVDEKHKLLFCAIPKVGCTTWLRVFLTLNGKMNFTEALHTPGHTMNRMWNQVKYLRQYPRDQVLYILDNYFKFIMVRDPIERLVSAYRNKLEPATGFFHDAFNKPIVKQYRKDGNSSDLSKAASFGEFVDYLVDPKRSIRMNNHWERYHVICDPCIVKYDFVADMADMDTSSKYVLDKVGRRDIQIPSRQSVGYTHPKTSSKVKQYTSSVSELALENLYMKYRLDFELFNYTKYVTGKARPSILM